MYVVCLNDVTIKVKRQDIFLLDVFGDMSGKEIESMKRYLISEGFVNPNKKINVFIQSKSFLPRENKQEDKKKD